MNTFVVLQNFRTASPVQIARWKETYGLTMTDSMLAFCISHYKTCEKRDPYADELKLLDSLSHLTEEDPSFDSVTELATNDSFVAATYADLLRKRKALSQNRSHPCTIDEATRIANAYLSRVGKRVRPIPAVLLRDTAHIPSVFPTAACIGTANSAYRLRVLSASAMPPQSNDLLVLLRPKHGQPLSVFQKAVETVLETPAIAEIVRGFYPIGQGGLLRKLLEQFDNLQLDLCALSPSRLPMPMTLLTDRQYDGCFLLRIAENAVATLQQSLPRETVCTSVLAKLSEVGGYRFLRGRTECFSLQTHFLRTVFRHRTCTATLSDEQAAPVAKMFHRVVTAKNCRYLAQCDGFRSAEAVSVDGFACATASSDLTTACFRTALFTALTPVLLLSACGIPTEDQQFRIGLDLPKTLPDPTAVGETLSTVLGIYRVQAELGIPAQTVSLVPNDAAEHPRLAVFTLAEGSVLPGSLTDEKNMVYCLSVPTDRDGLPDFSAFRQTASQLVHLNRTGAIRSMRVLCNESITDGLQQMCTEIHCRLADPAIASEDALPLAILLESRHTLPYRQVGTTVSGTAIRSDANLDRIRISEHSLIWSERPEIVLVSAPHDADAAALATVLSECGANVTCFDNDPKQANALSRAMLGAQTLILCPNVSLPQTERIDFAAKVMRSAGGNILALGTPSAPDQIALPFGFTSDLLQKLCKKNDKNAKKS